MTETTQPVPSHNQKNNWIRGLYMLLFLLIIGLTKGIVFLISVVQFLISLFSDGPNPQLLKFGQGLATYLYDISQFLMYNTEHKPFPFNDWKNQPPA